MSSGPRVMPTDHTRRLSATSTTIRGSFRRDLIDAVLVDLRPVRPCRLRLRPTMPAAARPTMPLSGHCPTMPQPASHGHANALSVMTDE